MKNILFKISLIIVMLSFSASLFAQEGFTYSWTIVKMDKSFDSPVNLKVKEIIEQYKPIMDAKMNEVIGYSNVDLSKGGGDSPMSNFVVDAMLEQAKKIGFPNADLAITNLGGIRTNLDKGDIRIYDIYSVSPFDNKLVILEIKGSVLKDLFTDLAKKRSSFEAVSNVSIFIKNKMIETVLIGGKLLDEDKVYELVTIDFLLSGGDGMTALSRAEKITQTNIFIRDALIDYVKDLTAKGEKINSKIDGRIIISD